MLGNLVGFPLWHEADVLTVVRNVRSPEQSVKCLLAASFSGFDRELSGALIEKAVPHMTTGVLAWRLKCNSSPSALVTISDVGCPDKLALLL